MEERKGTFFISLLVLLGLFFVFDYAKGHTQSKLFSRNTQVPAARIPESEASQVLVLATVHLKSYGENFNHDALEGLLDTLERYNPDLIALESAAPLFVRDMFNSGGVNIEIMKDIGGFRASEFGKAARATLDMDWFEAKNRVEELLGEIKTAKKDSEIIRLRKEVVLNFLAKNDLYSALLQWSYLPENERLTCDKLDKKILDFFSENSHDANENVSIGIALARKLNHQRVYAVNDHRDKEDFIKVADRFSELFAENAYLKTQPWKPLLDEMTSRQNEAYEARDLLPFYLWMNSEEYMKKDLNSQWQIMFEAKLPDRLAQTRIAFWDVRNFGIAANIRRALALNPGKKILVIIGATHKIFLDALFRECMDVKVVQLDEV
jgi:hypothetical protein